MNYDDLLEELRGRPWVMDGQWDEVTSSGLGWRATIRLRPATDRLSLGDRVKIAHSILMGKSVCPWAVDVDWMYHEETK